MLYVGVVENRNDPLKLGRCQVRIIGLHTHDKTLLPTSDLPWSTLLAPSTSASISGIGLSPTGLVEGTVVSVDFWSSDPELQFPIITGTLHGIPQKIKSVSNEDSSLVLTEPGSGSVVTDSSGNVWKDSSGNPIVAESNINVKFPVEFSSASDKCYSLIKSFEQLKLTSYKDQAGIWTIGYGTTLIDGKPVLPGMIITEKQAEDYLRNDVENIRVPTIKNRVNVPITQSMFDSMISFAYNIGINAFYNSTFLIELNAGNYLSAAAQILEWNKVTVNGLKVVSNGLSSRRKVEKVLFLDGGIPSPTGELTPSPKEFTGISNDSSDADSVSSGMGFTDPSGKYPLYINEPDTHRLVRHENIKETVVFKKESALDRDVPIAGGGSWTQSPIPYNAEYPYNHVQCSESGHLLEFDDTPGSERVHIYHKSGTFTEIDSNGTQVNRIVGDSYEIVERHGYVHIKGAAHVTVDGQSNAKVGGAMNLDINGVVTINIHNDVNLNVANNLSMNIGGEFKVKSNSISLESDGIFQVKSGGNVSLDGTQVHLNSGLSGGTGLGSPIQSKEVTNKEFPVLNVRTRGEETERYYETPEEGDSTEFTNARIRRGETTTESTKTVGTKVDSRMISVNNVKRVEPDKEKINSTDEFTPSFQLSANFNLGDLTKNGTRKVVAQRGLTVRDIVVNLKRVAENILEPILSRYPNLSISDGFRRPGDVAASASNSQHYNGEAVDISLKGFTRLQTYEAVQEIQKLIPYDQLILEYNNSAWIHISIRGTGNRGQLFTMNKHKKISEFGEFVLVTA